MAEKANTRFFFMGCWNNDVPVEFKNGTEKVTYYFDFRQAVIDLINKNIPIFDYKYGIILGDNMYKQKKDLFIEAGLQGRKRTLKKKNKRKKRKSRKKKGGAARPNDSTRNLPDKFYAQQTFDFLKKFSELPMINLETHIILGNHDIEECIPHKLKQISYHPKHHLHIEIGVVEKDNHVLILINTNEEFYYEEGIYQPELLAKFLEEKLVKIIVEGFNKWIFICGHEPLGSIKQKTKSKKDKKEKYAKKRETNQKTQNLRGVTYIYNALQRINYRKIIYLAADTHNFQVNQLSICNRDYLDDQHIPKFVKKRNNVNIFNTKKKDKLSIPVIVAGTGGASPDFLDLPIKSEAGIREGTVKKTYKHSLFGQEKLCIEQIAYIPSFGYCDAEVSDNQVIIRYHHIRLPKPGETVDAVEVIHQFLLLNVDVSKNTVISEISGSEKFELEKLEELNYHEEPKLLCPK